MKDFKDTTKTVRASGGHPTDFGQNAQIARAAKASKGAHGAKVTVPGKKASMPAFGKAPVPGMKPAFAKGGAVKRGPGGQSFNANPKFGCK